MKDAVRRLTDQVILGGRCRRLTETLERELGRRQSLETELSQYQSQLSASQLELSGYKAELTECRDQLRRARDEAARIEEDLASLRGRLASVSEIPVPFYLTAELWPTAQPTCGPSPHRIMVCSIPKAGTYLVAALLVRLGCVQTELHLANGQLTDYRGLSREQARSMEYLNHHVDVPLRRALTLIRPGQFSVGHLECTEGVADVLRPFRRIFVFRDLRDALVSFMRFWADTSRGGPLTLPWKDLPEGPDKMLRFLEHCSGVYLSMATPMVDWRLHTDVFQLRFETLLGDQGPQEQERLVVDLGEFLGLPGTDDAPREILESVIGAPTMTWSGERSRRQRYWDERVEAYFERLGGLELNARLGYA